MIPKRQAFQPSGLVLDLPAESLPPEALTIGENVDVVDGLVRRTRGYEQAYSLNERPLYMIPNTAASAGFIGRNWLVATTRVTEKLLALVDDLIFDVTGLWAPIVSPGSQNQITGGVVNDKPVINNPGQEPYYWDQNTLNNAVALPGWDSLTTAQAVRPWASQLVAMDITDASGRIEERVLISDVAPPGDVPQSWTVATDNQAADRTVPEHPGALVDGAELGDIFILYKHSSAHVIQRIASQFLYSVKPLRFRTVGLMARNCVLEHRGAHIVLTEHDLVMHDGSQVRSLLQARVRRELFRLIDGPNAHATYLAQCHGRQEIWVCYVPVGSSADYPTRAFTVSMDNGAVGHKDLPEAPHVATGQYAYTGPTTWGAVTGRTWGSAGSTPWGYAGERVRDHVMIADYQGEQLVVAGPGAGNDGANIQASVGRHGLSFGSLNRKTIDHVLVSVSGPKGSPMSVRFGVHDAPSEPVTWSDARPFTIGDGAQHYIDGDLSLGGRYLAWEISTDDVANWRLDRLQFEYLEEEEGAAA